MTKRELIQYIYDKHKESEAWIMSVPTEIRTAFFDNPYKNARGHMILAMMQYIFTEEEHEWVDWLIHEWDFNPELTFSVDDVEYKIDSFDYGLDKMFELGMIKEREQ